MSRGDGAGELIGVDQPRSTVVPIRVVLAGEHAMLGEALAAFLTGAGEVRVIATLRVDGDLTDRLARLRPDVVVVDPGDGPFRTAAVVRSVRRSAPTPAVVVVSASTDAGFAVEAACAGADGWVAKSGSLEALVGAIRAVRDGHGWYPEAYVGAILRALRRTADGRTPLGLPAALSSREVEVLGHLLAGSRDSEIAGSMRLSLPTVRTHVRNLLRKLGVHSRVDAARLAADAGLEPPRTARILPAR